jgi:hypothetical protein
MGLLSLLAAGRAFGDIEAPPPRARSGTCSCGHLSMRVFGNDIRMLQPCVICLVLSRFAILPVMKNLRAEAAEKVAERLSWCTAKRDQAGITKNLAEGGDVEEVYGLGEAGLFDEFFYFMDTHGISDLFGMLEPKMVRKSNVSFHGALLIYFMRITAGLSFFWHVVPVLLRSQSLMRLIGYNGREVREGTSERGSGKRKTEVEIRGPLCAESVGGYISAITADALEKFFNGVIRILAAHSFFPKKIHALLDASEIESTERCEGRGCVIKEKAPPLRLRKGRIRKVTERVFGFKIWVVWDSISTLPLAMRFATIEVHDTQLAQEVVSQAIANIKDHARIVSLACDRGFLDGPFLWWLNTEGIFFYIPAKSNMEVYRDALSLVDSGRRQGRERKRSLRAGKSKTTVMDRWEVVGLAGLTSAGFYGGLGSGSHENHRDFVPNPLNAVVVLDDPYKKNNPESKTLVILTNAPVDLPLKAYDAYDDRSTIENGLFREAKQGWFIERPARNTQAGFRAHVYLTLITMALACAFRTFMDAQDRLESQGEETGIRKFREKVRQENGNKLIVFEQDRYAIFETYEFAILCGITVLKPRGVPETITKEDILAKYAVDLE